MAVRKYRLWLENPRHPSLQFKNVGGAFWSVRVGLAHRALGRRTASGMVWFWIGSHADYDKLLDHR
ncbi:MAG: hypothetical protein ACFE0O_01650 [Opitutales bacterium]